MILRAWGDPGKLIKDAANPLTTMKMSGNKAIPLEKVGPPNEPADSSKKTQAKSQHVDLLKAIEEKMNSLRLGSLDEVTYTREFSESARRNNFLGPRQVKEVKSSGSDSGQSILKPSPDGNGYFGETRTLRTPKLLPSKEETLKKMFMGFSFIFDLTYGHLLLEMNVAPSSERKSGFIIHF
jgi:hypothetical protein